MKNITLSFTVIGMLLFSLPATAIKIYECVDESGNSTFQDTCPPGTSIAGEKSFYTGSKKSESGNPDVPVTLYMVPACDACDVVKNVLTSYGANITEKNIENNVELQTELQEKSGGSSTLSVPTVTIGDTVIVGYNKQALISSLEEAGFKSGAPSGPPAPQPASGTSEAPTTGFGEQALPDQGAEADETGLQQ